MDYGPWTIDYRLSTKLTGMAAQLPDKILFSGEQLDLYSNPLEQFWLNTKKGRPPFITTPECVRGYVASWEIRNNKLLLKDIAGSYERNFIFFRKPAKYALKKLFPRSKNKPVRASWFSGKLRVPIGSMTLYEHSGYDSRFEKEFIVTIHEGEVIKVVTIDFKEKSLIINLETTMA
ncbi:MAG TPA: hypothetical protein VK589_16600 [Chryseolinea sp.]|nr:hypothetical protein [Chryseolinea sp.]